MSDRGENEALERVTREARGEPSPDLDWERIEQRLFERVDASEHGAPSRAGAWRIVAALAVAAVIALVAGAVLRGEVQTPSAQLTPAAPAARVFGAATASPINGAELRVGDTVASAERAMVVDHAGRASWTLEAKSRASVAELGEVIALRLESGALSAKVVPSPKSETFVVEVSSARVAVHGTAFRVERRASGFVVSVTEGVVAVGPAGVRGDTQGWRLTPGDSGEFSLDGKSGTVSRAPVSATTPAVEPVVPIVPGKPPVAANPPARPSAPGADEVAKSLDAIGVSAASCFAQHTTQGEVRVQVQTQVTVVFAADGRVEQLSFDPPLSPTITECVTTESKKLRVHESEQGAKSSKLLLLGS